MTHSQHGVSKACSVSQLKLNLCVDWRGFVPLTCMPHQVDQVSHKVCNRSKTGNGARDKQCTENVTHSTAENRCFTRRNTLRSVAEFYDSKRCRENAQCCWGQGVAYARGMHVAPHLLGCSHRSRVYQAWGVAQGQNGCSRTRGPVNDPCHALRPMSHILPIVVHTDHQCDGGLSPATQLFSPHPMVSDSHLVRLGLAPGNRRATSNSTPWNPNRPL